MRVYIAAPFVHKQQAAGAALLLEARGFTITKRWWEHRDVDGEKQPNGSTLYSSEQRAELQQQAFEDVEGVLSADVVVVLNLCTSEGKAVEQGIAIAERIPVLVYAPFGGYLNVFQHLGEGRVLVFDTWAYLMGNLASRLRKHQSSRLDPQMKDAGAKVSAAWDAVIQQRGTTNGFAEVALEKELRRK